MMQVRGDNPRDPQHVMDGAQKALYQQLIPDFPGHSLEWLKRTRVVGPVRVPLDQIDFEHRATWSASHEPKKVKLHQQLISEGKSKPIVLALIPGNPKFVCLDAHHRLLAYEAKGQAPEAWLTFPRPGDVEAALTMHAAQYSGGSKLDGTGGEVMVHGQR